jgi:glycosyltransferase involved in cell wall biosynthesis
MLSIVTPTLNSLHFIEPCLLSISKLTIPYEHIIVDGGSTDGTIDYVKDYYPNCQVLHQSMSTGMYAAIHQGFISGTGDVLCWINSDDYILPDAFSNAYKTLIESNSDILFADGWQHFIHSFQYLYVRTSRYPILSLKSGIMPSMQPSIIWKKSLYLRESLDFEKFKICGDLHMMYRMAHLSGLRYTVYRKPISVFLKHGNSLGDKNEDLGRREVSQFVNPSLFAKVCEKFFRLI